MCANGSVIGYLDMNTRYNDSSIPDQPVELICIGKMAVKWDVATTTELNGVSYLRKHCAQPFLCWRTNVRCEHPPGWKARLNNGLWVEWEDGIAYRKGVGECGRMRGILRRPKKWMYGWDRDSNKQYTQYDRYR